MDFSIEQSLAGTPDEIEDVLLDPAFVQARASLPKLGSPELLENTRDGVIAHQRIRLRFIADLSSAVTKVIDRDKLTWVDDATYDLRENRAEHTIRPDHYADRLTATYVAMITSAGDGSRRLIEGRLRVRMPLVGGKVEGAIVGGLRDYAVAEAALLDDWLKRS